MTRINLIPPSELADQHLFSEFREIKMVPKALARSIRARGISGVMAMVPPSYTLGKGHVSFFYDKGMYLIDRYHKLRCELTKRGVNFDVNALLDPDSVYIYSPCFLGLYTPTPEALALIRARIAEKLAMKPDWYRWTNTAPPPGHLMHLRLQGIA